MKYSFLIYLLLVPLFSFTQENRCTFSMEVKNEAGVNSFYISEVVDFRAIKKNIGIVHLGAKNVKCEANFEDGFEQHMQSTFNKLVPFGDDKIAVIAQIHNLSIFERISMFSEKGVCELTISFMKLNEDTQIRLGEFSSTLEYKSIDVTSKHSDKIVQTMINCLDQFSLSGWEDMEPDFSLDSVICKTRKSLVLKDGLYDNFNSLVNGEPIDTIDYEIVLRDQDLGHYRVYYKGTKKRIRGLFAFCQNGSVFISASNYGVSEYFVSSINTGRYILFEDYFSKMAVSVVVPIGATEDAASRNNNNPVTIKNNLEKSGIVLDMGTGLISVLTEKKLKMILNNYPEILIEYANGNLDLESKYEIIDKINIISE